MFTKITFLAGAGVGYVLGARAGRSQYEKIKSFAEQAEHKLGIGEPEKNTSSADSMPTYARM